MSWSAGERLGRYDVTALIGAGGMGEVYRAHDPSLNREIAIKVLPRRWAAEPDTLRRFQREAQAVASLNHPNIVTIYSVEEADGVHFIAMELVDGQSLGELIATGPLAVNRFFDLMVPLTEAVTAAHARGITHRDLKPGNVMVTDDGRVKVLDFGLAKFTGLRELDATRSRDLTQHGSIVGTVPYMSPEQLEGKPVDQRSDIFALGVVMYEAATGQRPFQADSGPAIMAAILRETPPSACALRPGLPSSLARVIERCLEKAPTARYQTAADLRNDLLVTRRDPGAGAASRVTSRSPEKSIAVLPFANLSPDPENELFADGITEEIINTLGRIAGLRVAARGSSFTFKGKAVGPRAVGQQLQVGTVLEGSVRKAGTRLRITVELVNAMDGYQLWSERYDRELEDIFDIQDEIAHRIAGRLQVSLTEETPTPLAARATDNLQAYEDYLKGRSLLYRRGRFIPQALTCFEHAVAGDPGFGLAWAGLADSHTTLGYYGMAAPHETMPRAKQAATRAVELDDSLAEAHCALAMVRLLHDFDVPGATREFQRALELNPRYPQATAWYATFVLAFIVGRFDEAVEMMAPIVEEDPLSGYPQARQSWLLAFCGRHDEGITQALAGIARNPESFHAHWSLQTSYTVAGRYPEAIGAGQATLAMSERHPFAMLTLGVAYVGMDRPAEARSLYDELTTRANRQWVSPCVRAALAATLGLREAVLTLVGRAVQERDPFLMISLGTFPITERLRHILREAGALEDVRRQVGLPPNV